MRTSEVTVVSVMLTCARVADPQRPIVSRLLIKTSMMNCEAGLVSIPAEASKAFLRGEGPQTSLRGVTLFSAVFFKTTGAITQSVQSRTRNVLPSSKISS